MTGSNARLPQAWLVTLLLPCSLGIFGCGGGETIYPVQGKVVQGDQPLQTGTVTFVPDESQGNESGQQPVGNIENGEYSVAVPGGDGAPPGWYKVVIHAEVPSDASDEYSVPKSLIDKKYGDAKTTPLTLEVVANPAAGAYDLKVE